ncbi:VOC family protein [Streptomyces sp. NPDC090442]|uniref:VOC family protein n=1 Tax=Streptomyces sp. NPDC090442 TaxID=3365962 RepID=UPI0037FA18BD
MTATPMVCPALGYRDAKAAIDQLTTAFGFIRSAVHEDEDGTVVHAELTHGNGMLLLYTKGLGGAFREALTDAGPAGVYVLVEDTDAHCERARQAGAEILMEPTDQDYGSRQYTARDVEGNVWSFGTYRPGTASA